MIDKEFTDENSFLHDPIDEDSSLKEPTKKKTFFQEKYLEKEGQKLLFFLAGLLLVGLAAPSVLIYLFKSPQPEQHLFILGVSYYKFLFIFFLSASIVAYSSVFFLKANPLTILIFFLLSLFCCFPLVVGLRNNLTFSQAIDIPFFSSWPFFLNPAYVLIEFMIPVGIVIYLFLQVKSVFSRKQNTYAFFGAAFYLVIAAFLGFSALTQAGQPNIASLFRWGRGNAGQFSPGNKEAPEITSIPVPQVANRSSQSRENQDAKPLPVSTDKNLTAKVEFNQELQRVSEKMDRILEVLARRNIVAPISLNNSTKATAADEKPQNPDARQNLNPAVEPRNSQLPVEKFGRELQQISVKLARIADELSGMEALLSKQSEPSPKTPGAAKNPQTASPHPGETTDDWPPAEKITEEEINQRLRQLSAKVEQIWEMLTHQQSLPPKAAKAKNQ